MTNLIRRAWGYFLDIFFPSLCIKCRRYLESDEEKQASICKSCFSGIPVYKTISYSPRFTLAAVTSYDNDAVREILHSFKYRSFHSSLAPIELLIHEYLKNVDLKNILSDDTLVLPVPLHKKRLRERGFNQAEEIAKIVSEKLSLEIKNDVIIKTKDTPHLTTLENKDDRRKSVRDSFDVSEPKKIKGRDIILVDDVYTSGATANEIIKILHRKGAEKIILFVFAKTG